MASKRPFSTGKHCRHYESVSYQARAPDGENIAANLVQATRANPISDRAFHETERCQLVTGHEAMLASRYFGHDLVTW